MSDDLDDIVENLREPSAWIRVLFMLGFTALLYLVLAPLVLVVTLAQALFSVFTGEDNDNLRNFSASLIAFVTQILKYLTFNSNRRPFPFSDFPYAEAPEKRPSTEPDVDDTAPAPEDEPVANSGDQSQAPAAAASASAEPLVNVEDAGAGEAADSSEEENK